MANLNEEINNLKLYLLSKNFLNLNKVKPTL